MQQVKDKDEKEEPDEIMHQEENVLEQQAKGALQTDEKKDVGSGELEKYYALSELDRPSHCRRKCRHCVNYENSCYWQKYCKEWWGCRGCDELPMCKEGWGLLQKNESEQLAFSEDDGEFEGENVVEQQSEEVMQENEGRSQMQQVKDKDEKEEPDEIMHQEESVVEQQAKGALQTDEKKDVGSGELEKYYALSELDRPSHCRRKCRHCVNYENSCYWQKYCKEWWGCRGCDELPMCKEGWGLLQKNESEQLAF